MKELLLEFFKNVLEVNIPNNADIMRQKIRNPLTNHDILVGTALQYEPDHPARVAAEKLMKPRDGKPPEPPATKPATKPAVTKIARPTVTMSPTKRSGKTSPSDIDAARRTYPEARDVSVIDTMQDDEITKVMEQLGIPTGEGEALPADLEDMQKGYGAQGLDGHYGDDQYYQRMIDAGRGVRNPRFKLSGEMAKELERRGFPAKYIQLIERAMNVQAEGEEPRFSDMISGVGAGQNSSQFGEIMSMAMVAMPLERRGEFASMMKQQIQESKLAFLRQTLGEKEFKRLQQDPKALAKAVKAVQTVATSEWIDAAVGHASAFDSYMNEMYGEGQWKLEGTAWDRKSDIEQLGLDYANKGFSTDAMFRVQPLDTEGNPTGPAKAVRASLKKDEKVMLFNGGVGEIKNLVRTSYLPPVKRRLYGTLERLGSLLDPKKSKTERETALIAIKKLLKSEGNLSYDRVKKLMNEQLARIDAEARESAPPHVRDVLDRVGKFTENQKSSALNMAERIARDAKLATSGRGFTDAVESAAEEHKSKGWSKDELAKTYKLVKKCANAKVFEQCMVENLGSTKADRISKICTMAGAVAAQMDKKHKSSFNSHLALARDLGREYIALFDRENPEMVASLMGVLKEKFPMGVVMGGGEMMIINGTHVGARTLQTMFGVESYDELQLGLKLLDVDGEIMLVYEGTGNNARTVVIGAVDCRQKGSGYAPIGFEIKCSDEFVLEAAQSNEKNGTVSEPNAEAIRRISGRIGKRQKGIADET